MLYRLEIENFSSIRDHQVLDLTIAPNVSDPAGRYGELFPGSDLRAPKVLALYGPNASGKTTVLKALDFLVRFARDSGRSTIEGFGCPPFNDQDSMSRPMRLTVEFGGAMDLSPTVLERAERGEHVVHGLYRYELCLDVQDGNPYRVKSEALRQKVDGKGKWARVFERDEGGKVLGSSSFSVTKFRHLESTLRRNASVLSSFALFQHPTAALFVDRLGGVISNLNPIAESGIVSFLAQQPSLISHLSRDLGRIDIGVSGMRMADTPSGPQPMFRHEGLKFEMPLHLQSNGTRTFIRIFPLLVHALEQGGIAVIDEFDTMIHAAILPDILRWFYDQETRNPKDAQLWLSCHSASLLDDLTKEEVILCEKDSLGRTKVFSLMDVKSVRRDDNLYRKYLSGAYGALPHIG